MTRPDDPAAPFAPQNCSADQAGTGLTKREFFSALALQGMLADTSDDGATPSETDAETRRRYAGASVAFADALITALNATRPS